MSVAGNTQGWLQERRWPLWRLGNAVSTVRYWFWVLRHGSNA